MFLDTEATIGEALSQKDNFSENCTTLTLLSNVLFLCVYGLGSPLTPSFGSSSLAFYPGIYKPVVEVSL